MTNCKVCGVRQHHGTVREVREDHAHHLQAENERLRSLCESIEWSATRRGAPSNMGRSDGVSCRSCPSCKGVHPEAGNEFRPEALGHRDHCPFLLLGVSS